MATDTGGGNLLIELKRMVETGTLDETTYRRLMLVAMIDIQERMRRLESKRDWIPLTAGSLVAILAIVTVWLRP